MSTQDSANDLAQDRRLFAASVLTAALLSVAALGSVATADDITSTALEGAGLGALLTTALAFGLVDQAVRQLGSAPGSRRTGLVMLGLLGLLWSMVRVGLGDVWIVPGIAGLLFVTMLAAFFTEPVDEEVEEGLPADEGDTRADLAEGAPAVQAGD